MKTLFLLFPILAMSQVGINTTNPTNTIDVNGTARVRSLSNGATESDANGVLTTAPYKSVCMGVVDNAGNLLKGFGATTTKINNTTFRVTFLIPQIDNDYIIMVNGKRRNLFYDNVTVTGFDVIIETNPASVPNFDFNFVVYKI